MVGVKRYCTFQRRLPVGQRLLRQTINQVQADIGKPSLPCQTKCGFGFLSPMHPADRRQHFVIKALHAKTQSVETLPPQRGQRFGGNGSRIGFNADFSIIRQPKVTPDCLQNQCQRIRRQNGRRAAAKKQRIDAERGEIAARCGDFPAESGDIFLLHFFISDLRHKTAVAAFCLAERNMNVNS